MLEQRLRVLARGAELVADTGDRRRAVARAQVGYAAGEPVERGGVEVEVARNPYRGTGALESPQRLQRLRRRQAGGRRELTVGARLLCVVAQQREQPQRRLVERLRLARE